MRRPAPGPPPRSRRRTAFVLVRGLVVGVGAIALVVGALAVFGDGGPSRSTGAVAEASNPESGTAPASSRPSATAGSAAPRTGSATTGATGSPAGSATPTTGPGGAATVTTAPAAATGGAPAPAAAGAPAAPAAPASGGAPAPPPPPPPPPTTAPPVVYPSATVAPGPGGTVTVTLANFPPATTFSVACYHIIVGQGTAQFDSYSATTDGSGSSTTSSCVWSESGTHVYVIVTGPGLTGPVGSNHYQFP